MTKDTIIRQMDIVRNAKFMRSRPRVSLKIAVLMFAAGFLIAGCRAPKQFAYISKMNELGVARCGTQFDKVSIAVLPMTDSRTDKTSTEGWSMLAFLPFVPYMSYHNYDMEHYSANIGELKFDTLVELRGAIIDHIRYDGLAEVSSVRIRNSSQRQYTLRVNINDFGIDGYRTAYCLGFFPGCYLMILGAPIDYAEAKLSLKFTLRNPAGHVILSKSYDANRSYCVGEYYNWNPFKQVGFNLASIMNRACVDMAQAIADDYPGAQLTYRDYVPKNDAKRRKR